VSTAGERLPLPLSRHLVISLPVTPSAFACTREHEPVDLIRDWIACIDLIPVSTK
jgi:hypothetical protein